MAILYETIEKLCEARGISVTDMCRESGASRGSLTDLKMGRIAGLHPKTLQKVADYFGISIDELLGREIEKPATESDGHGYSDKDIRLLEWFRSLPKEKQQAILTAQDAPKDLV